MVNRKGVFLAALAVPGLVFSAAPQASGAEASSRRLAYVSNLMSHSVSVIDLDAGAWLRDLNLGRYPIFSALHPHDPTKMILALHNYDRTDDDDRLVIVDLATEKVIKSVPFPGKGLPSGFVYDHKRDRIYVADENLHKVFALDGTTLDPIIDFPAGLIPVHVDISPDCRWLVATNRKSANLYVYDLDSILGDAKNAIYTVPLGAAPGLDWDTEASGTAASHPLDVKFGSDNRICYVTDFGTKELLVVDISRGCVTDRVRFATTPFDFTLNRERSLAYVCHVEGDLVSVVDLAKKAVVGEITGLVGNPIHCDLDEAHGVLVVACWGGTQGGGIHVVDLATRRVLASISPPGAKASIGITITPPAN